ncbi:hypothetical protein RIF29_14824 [Crotalaria pallida]|uniref:Uncharacterized protein n=1 Tax=Crotalaria pallida TaxID=3830 RepID=A0AAN9IIN5_CROPI
MPLSRRRSQPSEPPSPSAVLNCRLTHSPAYLYLPIKHTHEICTRGDKDGFTLSTASRFKSARLPTVPWRIVGRRRPRPPHHPQLMTLPYRHLKP